MSKSKLSKGKVYQIAAIFGGVTRRKKKKDSKMKSKLNDIIDTKQNKTGKSKKRKISKKKKKSKQNNNFVKQRVKVLNRQLSDSKSTSMPSPKSPSIIELKTKSISSSLEDNEFSAIDENWSPPISPNIGMTIINDESDDEIIDEIDIKPTEIQMNFLNVPSSDKYDDDKLNSIEYHEYFKLSPIETPPQPKEVPPPNTFTGFNIYRDYRCNNYHQILTSSIDDKNYQLFIDGNNQSNKIKMNGQNLIYLNKIISVNDTLNIMIKVDLMNDIDCHDDDTFIIGIEFVDLNEILYINNNFKVYANNKCNFLKYIGSENRAMNPSVIYLNINNDNKDNKDDNSDNEENKSSILSLKCNDIDNIYHHFDIGKLDEIDTKIKVFIKQNYGECIYGLYPISN